MSKEKKEKVEEKKEVALEVKKDAQVALYQELMDKTPLDSRDFIVPKILLMQGMSDAVTSERAVPGEMRDSIDNKKLGDKTNPVEIIPFKMFKSWVIYKEVNGKDEYVEQVPFSPENSDWKWEAVVNGEKLRRDQAINYFCLIPSEIKEGVYFPYLMSFRRTSYFAGRKLETARAKLQKFGKPVSSKTFLISANKTENDKGVFYTFDVTMGRNSEDIELAAVKVWMEEMKHQAIKVDDSDLKKDTAPGPSAPVSNEPIKGEINF